MNTTKPTTATTLAPTTTKMTTAEITTTAATTAASKPSILVLNNKSSWKQPFTADFNGKRIWSTKFWTRGNYLGNVNKLDGFESLDADGTCGAMMNGVYWLIGGYGTRTQVREVIL